jgi:hypothetical protein
MNKVLVDTLYRVYSDEADGADGFPCITVGDFPDAPDSHIGVFTTEKSIEWYGKLFLGMTPEFAIALGETLIKAGKAKKGT